MSITNPAIVVVATLVVGGTALDYFAFGNTGDYLPQNSRMGEWRKAEVREACFPATEAPEKDRLGPQLPTEHRIDFSDFMRAGEMTAALNCYVVTNPNAVCDRNNRAYIVDYIGRYFGKIEQMV